MQCCFYMILEGFHDDFPKLVLQADVNIQSLLGCNILNLQETWDKAVCLFM